MHSIQNQLLYTINKHSTACSYNGGLNTSSVLLTRVYFINISGIFQTKIDVGNESNNKTVELG